jgi:hypothetical protein
MPAEFRQYRSPSIFEKASLQLKAYSKCLEIRLSSLRNTGSSPGAEGGICYGIFAVGDIYRGEQILTATHPFGISLEQTGSRCYNCFKDLGPRSSNIHSFDCCPKKRFCGVTCQQIAELYYHKALCGKDFTRLEDKAQAAYGGKIEGPLLKKLVGWEDKAEKGYPREGSFISPDSTPLILAGAFAICLQAGGHPLEDDYIPRLMPSGNLTTVMLAWSLASMVIGPIDALQTFGVDVFAGQRYDGWVMMTIW